MGPVILFDFDGTLCNSLPAVAKILNRLSSIYRFKRIEEADLPKLRQLGSLALMRELEIPIIKIPAIAKACKEGLRTENLEPFAGIPAELAKITRKGILSSNSEENISRFLKEQNILMEWIYSGSTLFGKARLLKKCMNEHGLSAKEVIYVGDEIRDIEAAKKVGVKVVSVAWGFNSAEALRRAGADAIVENVDELSSVIARSAEDPSLRS